MNKDTAPLVSVVIATKNEEKNIERCLASITKQTFSQENIEIIVIDADSQDKTRELAEKTTNMVFNLVDKINVNGIKNIRGAQLNFGVKKSRGHIIFFPDADMTFDKDLLNEALNLMNKDHIDALYIPEVVMGKNYFGKIRNFERSFYNMTPIDAVRIVRKSLFIKVGGFDEKKIRFGPDDWDFTKRIRINTKKIDITSSQLYHHEEDLGLLSYLTKKQKYGNTFDEYIKKWGSRDPDIKKQLGISYRGWGIFVENGKWKKLVQKPVLSLGMFVLKLAVGAPYLYQKLFKKNET